MTVTLSSSPASEYSLADIAKFFTRAFEGYFVPVAMTEKDLLSHVRADSVDLSESRVALADGSVAGVALIARRGWTSRVAGMGIIPEWRRRGVGKHLMLELLNDAHHRRDHEMVLEVIVQNDPAVHLYESVGFRRLRRLVSLGGDSARAQVSKELEEIDTRELGRLIAAHGLPDLPWQLSSETVAQYTLPFRAYRLNGAYAMISNPDAANVRFYSLLVEPGARHAGRATCIIQAMLARHPGKHWNVPAIFPEETAGAFEAAGFQRENLAQWQMKAVSFQ
jgi:ribosomal protein S18 acetylase RimI-like enzyme